ncbi:hypothetical protein CATYP_07635 [Corynebacterium atypicum]|uniref:RNase H type-1 domain-containing protein n=1 Tax=Corynebacterium atypicum TaxID=191610 RepID=A0ABN4DG91_9CORY|nr:hypothetical protein CATYP_07635 [Corynebacterium atypicum]
MFADGGSRGNPGIAGSGSVIIDAASGQTLRTIAWVVGKKATNNVAEYQGLINGLQAAADLGAREVAVRMDSKLVVEQMSGRWKIKHPDMQKLALRARELLARFAEVTFTWVPRKENAAADALANEAMDAAEKGHEVGEVGRKERNEAASAPSSWRPPAAAKTTLILLRHGQTEHSAGGRYSGRGDLGLTEEGERQAKAAAQVVRSRGGIDGIVASPLQWAQQSAGFVADAVELPVETVEELTELDFGDWEGLTYQEAAARDPELHRQWLHDAAVSCPGGENLDDLYTRVSAWAKKLVAERAGQIVVVVSHVSPIKAILGAALGVGPQVFDRVFLDLSSLSVVEFFDSHAVVHAVNLTGGLPR